MRQITQLGLFSGIGGFEKAAKEIGWKVAGWCEWDGFCQKILKYHFPNANQHTDIKQTDFTQYADTIDVLTGGFPCQPFSLAGNRAGQSDDRYLWPQMLRAIKESRPRVVVAENVTGLFSILEPESLTEVEHEKVRLFCENEDLPRTSTIERIQRRVIATVIEDLRQAGYVLPELADGTPVVCCVPAAGVGAPHKRDRVWIVAFISPECPTNGGYNTRTSDKIRMDMEEWKLLSTRWEQGTNNTFTSDSLTTNPKSGNGNDMSTSNTTGEGHKERKFDEGREDTKKDSSRVEFWDKRFSKNEFTPNPSSDRWRREWEAFEEKDGQQEPGHTGNMEGRPERLCSSESIADTNLNERCKRGLYKERCKSPERHTCACTACASRDTWENFPTQSPVCSGDDGIPSGLDGITFSKWRKESIKSYGNAIVPQVAMAIFKSIDTIFNETP